MCFGVVLGIVSGANYNSVQFNSRSRKLKRRRLICKSIKKQDAMKITKQLSYHFLAWLGRRIYSLRLRLEAWNNQVDLWAGRLDPDKFYTKLVSPLTDNLDQVYEDLVRLTAVGRPGGSLETCGKVIDRAIEEIEAATE